jgi:hypothetical protein
MDAKNIRAPLLANVSQYDVDFVIPRVGTDVPVGIDPFLLYKSRSKEFRELHSVLIGAFNAGIDAVRRDAIDEARRLFDFPEVAPIGFGYTQSGKRGSGVGSYMAGLIVDTLSGSPDLQSRGIRHVEEMQLVSAGIGPDRVSDIAANVLKSFLIGYTQKQCAIWGLPMKSGVPIGHVYDDKSKEWFDTHEDLPVSDADGSPVLFVPRRLVRVLPWINYDDFLKTEFAAYLAARRAKQRRADPSATLAAPKSKREVVGITRTDVALIDRYVRSREQLAAQAHPAHEYIDEDACEQAAALKERLMRTPHGREAAAEYQRLVLEILNFLLTPELTDGQPEVKTIDGTERRDIIFTNDSDETFWDYVRNSHDGILVMFEVKNVDALDNVAINQTATYLGDRVGRLGVIVTREAPSEGVQRKIFSVWNDSGPNRKVILVLADANIADLLDLSCRNESPTKWMQKHYRAFRTSVQ